MPDNQARDLSSDRCVLDAGAVQLGDRVLVNAPRLNDGALWAIVIGIGGRHPRRRILRVSFRNTVGYDDAGEFPYGVAEVIDYRASDVGTT